MRSIRRIAVPALLATLCACGAPLVDDSRNVTAFSRIEVDGSADLSIIIDETATSSTIPLTVSAAKEELDEVESVVEGGTLFIRDKRVNGISFGGGDDLRVSATIPALLAVSASDFSNATVEGIVGDTFDAVAGNFANVTLSGTAAKVTITASDEAEVRAKDLSTQKARVAATNFADVEVCASELLDAEVSGEALIRFFCSPAQVEDDVRDRGTLEPAS